MVMANMLEFVVTTDVSNCETVRLKLQDVARSRILDAAQHGVPTHARFCMFQIPVLCSKQSRAVHCSYMYRPALVYRKRPEVVSVFCSRELCKCARTTSL